MKNKTKHATREEWLLAAVELLKPLFKANNYDIPVVRVSCGWPSARGLSRKKWVAGECWATQAADDKRNQIFISPRLKDPLEVLSVLVHEVVHAVVGLKERHNKVFGRCARAVGLEGKLTQTHSGDALLQKCKAWAKVLGSYPHAQLSPSCRPTKKQTTRLVKCECKECGYNCRTTRKWLEEAGAPWCPTHRKAMHFEMPDELEDDE